MPICLRKLSVSIFMLLLGAPVLAQQAVTPDDVKPGLGGYSPVSYFTEERPQRGSREHTAVHADVTYHFTSEEQVELFRENPEKYAPLFPHHCPYNLALGRAAAIDPTNYRIVGGRLLVFHHSEEMNGGEQWDKHDKREQEELLKRARANIKLLEF